MRPTILTPELRELLQEGRTDELRQVIEELHPNDAAQHVAALEPDEIVQVMTALPVPVERDLFTYFATDVQEEIVRGLGRNRLKALLQALSSDDRFAFLDKLDERIRERLVPLLEQAQRADILQRERFAADQVGSILSTEYVALKKEMTAAQAIASIRRQEAKKETIYYAYVIDDAGKLIGFVSLRNLLTAAETDTVERLMKTGPVSVVVTADQEEAARLIREYDLLALPVVDENGVLVGIVTYDDAADIQAEEETEDVERMAGLAGVPEYERGYLGESVLRQIGRRLPLIAFLAVFNLSTAFVIHYYEGLLPYGMLIALLPIVMALGGMVGGQSSVLVVRGLSLGDVVPRQIGAIFWKELRVSSGMATVLASIVFVEALILGRTDARLGDEDLLYTSAAVAIAMVCHVLGSALIGVGIPVLAKWLGGDPAIVSTPAVTALADLFGASVFCTVSLTMLT